MASNIPANSPISRSKTLPWYFRKIGYSLTPAGRQLLEQYGGIEPSEVEKHVYKIRKIAWQIHPWPCVGTFLFINLGLSLHPSYQLLLTRLRAQSNSVKFLDLGTCLGQNLRKLAFDGVPVESLYGSDKIPDYERLGQELFHDADKFKGRFISADLFADDADSALVKSRGSWDVVSIVSFLHIFDWETQIRACKRVIKLLAPKPGSMVIGSQSGSTQPEEKFTEPSFVTEGAHKSVFRQSVETFRKMWKIVEQDEGILLKVDVIYGDEKEWKARKKEEEEEESPGKKKYFSEPETRALFFTVEIV